MRGIRVPVISIVAIAAMTTGIITRTATASEYGYPIVPPSSTVAPGMTGLDADAIGRVLDTISSPARRDKLAEDWVQFAKQSISKSLDISQQWVDVRKAQLRNQPGANQYQTEALKLQMEIEQLHRQNLALEAENLRLRLQLQQSAPQPANGPAPGIQSP
jgi:hypothetical protein